MTRNRFLPVLAWVWPCLGVLGAELTEFEPLPAASREGGKPLMEVLGIRKSTRQFSVKPIERATLGNLLWAAFGVNRPETGQRTAPSTMDLRCIDIYVVTAAGSYRYEAERHGLIRLDRADTRSLTGGQDYVKTAPVALVYVADHAKLARAAESERDFYAAADAGFIGQNVYLVCASEGLGCVVHMPGDRAGMARVLGLREEQRIVLVHSVGYAASAAE
jgi:SagB-type dehydrogenase family enzyme